ncbi:DUF4767 domain-containing protein [Limosilactobacillus caviae]|uniref:L,D-TPase catalytic domain-containing protein n=1 Tax=Limosilactobacillus caviae TaxID=1769424 RepID=A0ABQ2C706_9LACO|nr:DUF4767 domain-containing protein [Limosilactobacillus caviae]MRH47158.1 DUF4767 domain-containing protein [Limosilactobacillus reuteri]GGI64162.1 hypothetical protein GCM10011459_19960 [Limosilactobacillus caviae]
MKKKLYKAKKNWVIGIIAGMALLISGGTVTYADSVQGSNVNVPEQNDMANNLAPKTMNAERNQINMTNDASAITPQSTVQENQWNQEKAQRLDAYMTQYGQQHNMDFQKYDGSTPMPIDCEYPEFDITKLWSDREATIGYSQDGANKYDYNTVAIYNHYAGNRLSQFHDTYWFTIHNNQPVVLEDSTTNGGTVWLNNINDLSQWDDGEYVNNTKNFQAAFTQILNNAPLYNFEDHGNYAWLDEHSLNTDGQLNLKGWHATNDALNKRYHYSIILDGKTHREIARQNITNSSIERKDVKAVYDIYNAEKSGFDVTFNIANSLATAPSIQLVDRYTDDPAGNGDATDYWFAPFTIDHGNYGSLDNVSIEKNQLHLAGWHASNSTANKKYHYIIVVDNTNNNRELIRVRLGNNVSRPDVAKVLPSVYHAGQSGFDAYVKLTNFNFNHQLQVIDRYTDDPSGNGNAVDYWYSSFGGQTTNQGWLDNINFSDGQHLTVSGWHANDVTNYEQEHFVILFDSTSNQQVAVVQAKAVKRPDVAKVYPGVKTAINSGFQATFDLTKSKLIAGHSYAIVSRYSTATDSNGDQGAYTDYWFRPNLLTTKAHYFDKVQMTKDGLQVAGWAVDDSSINRSNAYLIILNNGKEITRQRLLLTSRPDVARVYPSAYNSLNSGFDTLVKFDPQLVTGQLQVLVRFTNDPAGNGNYSDQISTSYNSNVGNFDQIDVTNTTLTVSGWHATDQSNKQPYQYLIALGENGQELYRWQIKDKNLTRLDVFNAVPYILNSSNSGYQLSVSIPNEIQHHTVRFIHRYTDDPNGNGNYSDIYSNSVMVNNLMRTPIDFRQPSEYAPYPNIKQLKNFWINVKIGQNRVYMMDGNNIVYTMYCTAGRYVNGVSLTPTGTYYVQPERGNIFEWANHWTSWKDHGVYLFHSVVFDQPWHDHQYDLNQAKLLGVSTGSHGCIRLSVPDAYWIQHNVSAGTKVVIEN